MNVTNLMNRQILRRNALHLSRPYATIAVEALRFVGLNDRSGRKPVMDRQFARQYPRFSQTAAFVLAAATTLSVAGAASAQDGGAPPGLPMCPGALTTGDVPVSFMRTGPVDFGPGTGMQSVGDHQFGVEYNLLFSGNYHLNMAGTLHVNWLGGVAPLTVTTTPRAGSGLFDVTFGLRMLGRIWVLGVAFDLPLSQIIMDNVGMDSAMFDPWEWEFGMPTHLQLDVSAWREVYSRTLTIAGMSYPVALEARYNMEAWARTKELAFPVRMGGAAGMTYGAIDAAHTSVAIPTPTDGRLNLAVRWQPQLRYRGSLQFRLIVRRQVCALGVCTTINVPTPDNFLPIVTSNEPLPSAFEPTDTPVLVPLVRIDERELDFGMVRVGTSGMQQVLILNPGASPLALALTNPAEAAFRVGMGNGCVPPAGSTMFPVTFMPPMRGLFRSELLVNSNGASNNPARITLVGEGAEVTMPPAAIPDGGRRDSGSGGSGPIPDGGRRSRVGTEYSGAQLDAGCACRAPSAPMSPSNAPLGALAGAALCATIITRRTRRRATSNN